LAKALQKLNLKVNIKIFRNLSRNGDISDFSSKNR